MIVCRGLGRDVDVVGSLVAFGLGIAVLGELPPVEETRPPLGGGGGKRKKRKFPRHASLDEALPQLGDQLREAIAARMAPRQPDSTDIKAAPIVARDVEPAVRAVLREAASEIAAALVARASRPAKSAVQVRRDAAALKAKAIAEDDELILLAVEHFYGGWN